MKLHNTLSRKIEDIKPVNEKQVTVYSCGPTVYDHIHIGNLSSFIYVDTLRRVLKTAGYSVKHVMNFTDVDDKTIRRSLERYPDLEPMEALQKLTAEYGQIFLADMGAIGNDVEALIFVHATKSILSMQQLISRLHKDGFAYITDDGAYFSIEKYRASGKQYGQLLDLSLENTSVARIDNDEYDKESVHDFALWKKQKPGEPAWDFTLDGQDLKGRPGWHIECSAMSVQNLGQPFDIHTGGVDLTFPHHENEIAQSTAGKQAAYANLFFHNEHLLVDGKKMSKSLNNFTTLKDIVDKGFDPLAFRLMILQSHYHSQSNFTWENLEAAQNRLRDLQAWADLRFQPSAESMPPELGALFGDTLHNMRTAAEDNLNIPSALISLGKIVSWMQQHPVPGVEDERIDGTLRMIDDLLGLNLSTRNDITVGQKQQLAERQKARESNDWTKSDQIRDKLSEQGIGVRDTDFGSQWYRL